MAKLGLRWKIQRPTAGERNAVGLSAFVGPNLTQGTYFYGLVGEYNRLLTSKWEFAVSVGASWEPAQMGKIEHGLSLILNGGYSLTERLSAEVAYTKEFARYSAETNYRWTWADGDTAVGIGASYTLWERARNTVGLERNLTASETTINFELGYGFSL